MCALKYLVSFDIALNFDEIAKSFMSFYRTEIMNKTELVNAVAASGITKADAVKAVESIFEAITDALKSGDDVRLIGFGTFAVAERKASTGRNPRTGEEIQIPASKQPKFKAGKSLKDAVNA